MHLPVLLAPAARGAQMAESRAHGLLFCDRCLLPVLPPDCGKRVCLEPTGIHCGPERAGNAFSEHAEFRPVLAPGLVFFQKNTGEKGPSLGHGNFPGVRTIAVAPAPGLF